MDRAFVSSRLASPWRFGHGSLKHPLLCESSGSYLFWPRTSFTLGFWVRLVRRGDVAAAEAGVANLVWSDIATQHGQARQVGLQAHGAGTAVGEDDLIDRSPDFQDFGAAVTIPRSGLLQSTIISTIVPSSIRLG